MHRTTIAIHRLEQLPSAPVAVGGGDLAGVGTGWFGAVPHVRFAIHLQSTPWSSEPSTVGNSGNTLQLFSLIDY